MFYLDWAIRYGCIWNVKSNQKLKKKNKPTICCKTPRWRILTVFGAQERGGRLRFGSVNKKSVVCASVTPTPLLLSTGRQSRRASRTRHGLRWKTTSLVISARRSYCRPVPGGELQVAGGPRQKQGTCWAWVPPPADETRGGEAQPGVPPSCSRPQPSRRPLSLAALTRADPPSVGKAPGAN